MSYGLPIGLVLALCVLALTLGLRPEPGSAEASSPTSVAVAKRGSDLAFARGVLVDRDLVLTVRHATHVHRGGALRHRPDALEVRLDVGGDISCFPVLEFAYTSERLDFALLRIGADSDGQLPPREAVQTLSAVRVPLGALLRSRDPIGEVEVLFPFEATEGEVLALRSRSGRHAGALDDSYVPVGDDRYLLYHARWALQPTLVVECRAPAGSSGEPLFDARGRVVGILFAGDDPTDGPSGWSHHDAVLPVAAIQAELSGIYGV